MRFFSIPALAGFSLFASLGNAALPHIVTKGSKFYTTSGEQFFIKGIAYQLDPLDTLLNTTQCRLDAQLMKKTGANAIRVYHAREPRDHSGCMKAFEDAGIYVFVDLDTFSSDISQYHPKWVPPQLHSYEAVMDEFQRYDNLAGFFIGNEVLTKPNLSEAAAFVKASTKYLKQYRNSKGYRDIPIGYSHADIAELRPHLQNYLACGDDELATIDFFGLNNYEWCGPNTYVGSNYANLTDQIKHYPKPIFLSETGCNSAEPRTFQDQRAVFGPHMSPYWSGAIIYEWIMEENHYGLVAYNEDATDAFQTVDSFERKGKPIPVTPDFTNLINVWKTSIPKSTPAAAYSPDLTPPACPEYTRGIWEVGGDVVLPTLGETLSPQAQFSITAGHPKGKPHQTTSLSSQNTADNAAAMAAPPHLLKRAVHYLSNSHGEGQVLGVMAAVGTVMLGLVAWL